MITVDFIQGIAAVFLLIDIFTKPIFVFYRLEESFLYYVNFLFYKPYIKRREKVVYVYNFIKEHGLRQALFYLSF
jgi:hypothetical protein